MGAGPVSWHSRWQPTVALSVTEAEIMAATEVTTEVMWLRSLMQSLGFQQNKPTVVFEDNHSAIKWAQNEWGHKRTKHMDTRYKFVCEAATNRVVELKPRASREMPADMLTKGLGATLHNEHCERIGMVSR